MVQIVFLPRGQAGKPGVKGPEGRSPGNEVTSLSTPGPGEEACENIHLTNSFGHGPHVAHIPVSRQLCCRIGQLGDVYIFRDFAIGKMQEAGDKVG